MEVLKRPCVGVVCYGNILRSQVLAAYLRAGMTAYPCEYQVYDAGISDQPQVDFPEVKRTLQEVEEKLQARGLVVRLRQTTWNGEVIRSLMRCNLILAADAEVVRFLHHRLPATHPPTYHFYELLDEGKRDFQDTYDYQQHRQKPQAFEASFDELERIANGLLRVLPRYLCTENTENTENK